MKTLTRVAILLLAGTIFGTFSVEFPVAWAGSGPNAKPSRNSKKKAAPKPYKQLATAYKKLSRTKGYRVTLSVVGGLSDNPQHKVTTVTVKKHYKGDVYRNLMHVSKMKAYRTPRKGVCFANGTWKNVMADREGKIMGSLFTFPQDVLNRALRHSRKAKWISSSTKNAKRKDARVRSGDEDSEAASPGKTVVRPGEKDRPPPVPRVLRIEIPPKEALNHYLVVEKSGCIGGG